MEKDRRCLICWNIMEVDEESKSVDGSYYYFKCPNCGHRIEID